MAAAVAIATIHLRLKTSKNVKNAPNFVAGNSSYLSTSRVKRSFATRASNSNREDENPTMVSINGSFTSKEDLNYLLKLGVGTFTGATIIKYGSALFPEITTPNISQALIMIFGPVIVATLLLIRESRVEQ